MRAFHRSLAGVALAALFAAPPTHAGESYDSCTGFITTLPATISTPGTWCLLKDLSTGITSGAAITVDTDNVTIDCNGYKLGGLLAGAGTQAIGIDSISYTNTTVRRCNIRGFYYGIELRGSGSGHLVEDNRFDANTWTGMFVVGDGSVVRRNAVNDTGGSTHVTGFATGIATLYSVEVRDNSVTGLLPLADGLGRGRTRGITTAGSGASVIGNRIRGAVSLGSGESYGIHEDHFASRAVFERNYVVGDGRPGSTGLRCLGPETRAKDNVVSGFPVAIANCSGTDNEVVP